MDRKNARRRLSNTGKSVNLPEELIEDILSALPAESLLRFRCVSKSWCCLIDSDRFIKTQLEKSIKDPSGAHWRVVFDCNYVRKPQKRGGLKQCSVSSYPKINGSPFDDSTNNHLTTTDCHVVGHCNGLLCIVKKDRCLFLWNPTKRMSIELLKLDTSYLEKYGFGMDEQSGAYKVFAVFRKHKYCNEYIGKVYSSETNSWKTVEHGCLDVEDDAGVLVGGKLHWLTRERDYIESFDLSSEVFERIELPDRKPGEDESLAFREASGRLSIFVYDSWELWVRVAKGGAKGYWVKEKIEVQNVLGNFWRTVYVESLVWPLPLKNHRLPCKMWCR